ncbi:MAG: GAF domain-containing sensor histidine kinase [Opitutales bacterium]|nr:GAF domain-containing sensor histidine kinase [Opitutales bacterium]
MTVTHCDGDADLFARAKSVRLWRSVVAAAQTLLRTKSLAEAAPALLAQVGECLQADRVAIARLHARTDGGYDCELLHEWTSPGTPRQMNRPELIRVPFAAKAPDLAAFLAGEPIQSQVHDLPPALRDPQIACGAGSEVAFPIFTDGAVWVLGVDDKRHERIWEADEMDFIRLLSDSIAAAIDRETSEQRRHEEKNRAVNMLTSIVTSSRLLIEAKDFEAGVLEWLGHFGRASEAIRSTLYDFSTHKESGQPTWRMLKEWVREGIENSIPVSFDNPHVIDPRGAEEIISRPIDEKLVVIHTDQVTGNTREFLEAQGNATVIALRITIEGRAWGALSLDFPQRREPSEADLAVLQTAADTLATVLKSRQANEEAIREREARIAAAERDNRELRRRECLLEAVSHTSRAFLQNPDYLAVLPDAFARIAAAIDIHRITYFEEVTSTDGKLAHHVRFAWNAEEMPSHKELDLGVLPNEMATSFISVLHSGKPVWRTIDAFEDAVKACFQRLRIRSTGCVPIFVRCAYHGAITFDDCVTDREWSETEIATLCAAANALASAIERRIFECQAREAEKAQVAERKRAEADRREAVLAERTRLAGVIHDTLAQGFVGVLLQLEAAEEARQRGRESGAEDQTEKARELARFGLAEARRSALAIRPLGSEHDALEQALQSLAERVFIAGRLRCDFDRKGVPRRLPDAHAEALLRIANEGINNALRHGGASHIHIRLKHTAEAVELRIRDNGRWRQPERAQAGLGLRSMRESITQLQGSLAIETGKNGTTVRATLPVPTLTEPS